MVSSVSTLSSQTNIQQREKPSSAKVIGALAGGAAGVGYMQYAKGVAVKGADEFVRIKEEVGNVSSKDDFITFTNKLKENKYTKKVLSSINLKKCRGMNVAETLEYLTEKFSKTKTAMTHNKVFAGMTIALGAIGAIGGIVLGHVVDKIRTPKTEA